MQCNRCFFFFARSSPCAGWHGMSVDHEAEKGTPWEKACCSCWLPLAKWQGRSLSKAGGSKRLQGKRSKVRAGDQATNTRCVCEVTVNVSWDSSSTSAFFPFTWPLFLLRYSFRQAMLELEFGESKPKELQSEQLIAETRKAGSCSSETLKSNAGSRPAAAGCPVSNPDNLWKSLLL